MTLSLRNGGIAIIVAVTTLLPRVADAGEIHAAAIAGDLTAIEALLDAGTPVDAPDPNGTPLIWALFGQQADAVHMLLDRGADPNVTGASGWTPLVSVVKMADPALVEKMLARGAEPNHGDVLTPLGAATEDNSAALVGLLLASRADPNVRMLEGWTALHRAAETGNAEIARLLLDAGADVNALTDSGRPALHYAIQRDHDDLAAALLAAGAAPGPVEAVSAYLATADPVAGESEAKVCARCHAMAKEGDYFPERPLWNIVDRPVGAVGDYNYTPALRAIGERWDYETLNKFIARPTEFAPGTTKDFVGIPEVERRAEIIVFLRTLSDEPAPLP